MVSLTSMPSSSAGPDLELQKSHDMRSRSGDYLSSPESQCEQLQHSACHQAPLIAPTGLVCVSKVVSPAQ